MTNGGTTIEIADLLQEARERQVQIPFIRHDHAIDEAAAYAVQDELIRRAVNAGECFAGYKVSMTSAETQAIAGTDEPAYGTLLTSHLKNSGTAIPLSTLFSPLIEPEILFILDDDLSPRADAEEILSNSRIAAGIEIPDARYRDWFPNFSLTDLISDNTATGLVVTSAPVKAPSSDELDRIEMELFLDGRKVGMGLSSAVLGNPLNAVEWLSDKLARRNRILKKGMTISSGTFISPLAAKEGLWEARFMGIGSVNVTLTK
ncbi:2-keto-4-pentenoate hydratase [Bhargavaea cecembensis]|uniref:2-keto-4-pentenoate hydratase n=1 Tax=Bhargavaea cecembensis TaxID=394098 RepID=A0A165H2L1_9BACL|nr:2-keto-4-pentenoate hydratase [Bhargavaea cecembensis]KZE38595.1 2-keto-4-pentenoate hydratase [Bhargavaea cecembensis]